MHFWAGVGQVATVIAVVGTVIFICYKFAELVTAPVCP